MTKKLFYLILPCLFLALEIRNLSFSPIFAIDPIIIDQSIQGPPVGTGKDQDYHSNDIYKTSAIQCPGTIQISQTFDPIVSGSGPVPTYQPYDVNKISSTVDYSGPYTNTALDDTNLHLTNLTKHPLSPDSVNQADLSLYSTDANGTSGLSARATTYAVSQCQTSQRLIYAVKSLDPTSSNLTYHNEQIGWNCSGQYYSLSERPNGLGCNSIRLSDVAAALANQDIFYPLSVNCFSPSLPKPTTLSAVISLPANFQAHQISGEIAKTLFRSVSITDNGSLASLVTVCSADASGNPVNCRQSEHQIPQGNLAATANVTVNQFIPAGQAISNHNLCQVNNTPSSPDQSNPLSFFAEISKLWGTVTNQSQTFSGSVSTTTSIDSRVQTGIDQDQAFLNDLIPAADQQKYQTSGSAGSSTDADGKTVDPGAPEARAVFAQELLPANF